MFDDMPSGRRTDPAIMWAYVAMMIVTFFIVAFGFGVAYWLGDKEWAKIYAIAVGAVLVIAMLFGGVYMIMRLLVGHALGLQQSNAELLHAHSQSGAQQARATTEVIRGANAMNKADADTQQEMLKAFGRIGAAYESQMAKMAAKMHMLQANQSPIAEIVEDGTPQYALPDEGVGTSMFKYKLPKIS